MAQKFIVKGRKRLEGIVTVSGSKNATLPLMAASLLAKKPSILKNVPDIADMHSMRNLLHILGAKTEYENHILKISPPEVLQTHILKNDYVKKLRASILLLAPLLARKGRVAMFFPGGCVLGKRSIESHIEAFSQLGCQLIETGEKLQVSFGTAISDSVILPELSVTATENILMLAASIPQKTTIYLAASEPHVQELCVFLTKMGAKIEGISTNTLKVTGTKELKGAEHEVIGDYLEAGTIAIATLMTKGKVEINGINPHQLDLFLHKLTQAGAKIERKNNGFKVWLSGHLKAASEIKTAVYPGFPTDLQAPFTVLMTQAQGTTAVFETLFEGRLNYLFELEKMGAKVEILNPHQALVIGGTPLKGAAIASCDIRAGAAMIVAALGAKGTTEISNIDYIDRGYEKIDEKLRSLGAQIERA